jgi:ribosome-binding factor A
MLAGRRAVRVGDQILKEVSFLILESVKDPRVRGVTLTGIDLSNDLKHCRIFFSVMGDAEKVERAKAGLDSATGFIKREIGLRMSLRYVPELAFLFDPTLRIANNMENLFEKLKNDQSGSGDE